MAKRTWYTKYIGYCFNDKNGHEVVLTDVFYYEDGRTGYECHDKTTGKEFVCDLKVFRNEIVNYTNLPK